MAYDLLIKDGTIVDGTGAPAFPGAVAVQDGKIAAVIRSAEEADAAAAGSSTVLDAAGLTVCPGFIDVHSHADWILPLPDHPVILAPLLEQGITTVIGGNCGYSPAPLQPASSHLKQIEEMSEFLSDRPLEFKWDGMHSFLEQLEEDGVALNVTMLAGHGTMRVSLYGNNYAYPGADGISALAKLAAAALEEGACGISLGLGYAPGIFSGMRELEGMARCAHRYGRLLTVHLRALSRLSGAYPLKLFDREPHNLKALREMLDLAERTGVKMQISHLIFVGKKTWPTVDRALEMIDQAVARGADIAFDSFPYLCGNTTIFVVYPTWFLQDIERNFRSTRARFRLKLEVELITRLLGFGLEDIQVLWGGHPEAEQYNGMFFGDIARAMGCPVLEAYLKISELSRGKTLCLLHKYSGNESDESAYRKVLAHPLNLVETDTILTRRGRQNPAGFGTFPRVIQRYHKELGLLSLEEAIAKMTGRSARRFGLKERGSITPGCWADLTVFDYAAIKDNTSFQQLEARPSGIRHVFVNGTEVVRDGRMLPVRPAGRVLRA